MGFHNNDSLVTKAPGPVASILTSYLSYLRTKPTVKNEKGLLSECAIYTILTRMRQVLLHAYNTVPVFSIEAIEPELVITFFIDKVQRKRHYNQYEAMLTYLEEHKLVKEGLAEAFHKKSKHYNNLTKRITDPAKVKKWSIPQRRWDEVYNQASTNPLRFACWLGLNFGLRLGELVHLRERDIIYKGRYILVREDEQTGWTPKTLNSTRKIPFTLEQEQEIRTYMVQRKKFVERFYTKGPAHDYILYTTWDGDYIREQTLGEWMKKISLEFEEEDRTITRTVRPHVLRYSFAIKFYYETLNLHTLSKLLGHSDIKTTEKYLALTKEQSFKEAQKLMQEVFSKKNNKTKLEVVYTKFEKELEKLSFIAEDKENQYTNLLGGIVQTLGEVKKELLRL